MRNRQLNLAAVVLGSISVFSLGVAANLYFENKAASMIIAGASVAVIVSLVSLSLRRRVPADDTTQAEQSEAIDRMIRVIHSMQKSSLRRTRISDTLDLGDVPRIILQEYSVEQRENPVSTSFLIARLTKKLQSTMIVGPAGSGKTTLLLNLAESIAGQYSKDDMNIIPMYLSCMRWSAPNTSFDQWIEYEAANSYGMSAKLVGHWLRTGTMVVMLDGIDQVPEHSRHLFIRSVNRWLDSSHGGKLVATCRSNDYINSFQKKIRHEQIATIQPLSEMQIERYVENLLRDVTSVFDKRQILPLLRTLRDSARSVHRQELGNPLLLQWLAEGVSRRDDFDNAENESHPDAGEVAVELGDELTRKKDLDAARRAYLAALNAEGSAWRSSAGLRLGLVLDQKGDKEGALRALQSSLAIKLEESLRSQENVDFSTLSSDEQLVLRLFEKQASYTEAEISSRSLMPPSQCRNALRRLRDLSIIDIFESEDGLQRFSLVPDGSAALR